MLHIDIGKFSKKLNRTKHPAMEETLHSFCYASGDSDVYADPAEYPPSPDSWAGEGAEAIRHHSVTYE